MSNTAIWPSKRIAAPETSGLPAATQARLTAWRVAKLSRAIEHDVGRRDQRGEFLRRRRAPRTRSTRTSGIDRARGVVAAASTLSLPMSAVSNRIWRCRLVEVDVVGVDQRDRADAGGGQKLRDGRAEAAHADDQCVRCGESLLRIDAELVKQDVPAVAKELCVVHGSAGALRSNAPARRQRPAEPGVALR